ncbi:MAG: Hsp20/alpha crystallin family protein [Bacteroidales bacterium]|nr:Hsp20/alpha crystallin family protein [Bacteroidales bacterium]
MLPTIVRRSYRTPSMFDGLFNDNYLPGFYGWGNEKSNCAPAVNVEETEKEFRIEVAAPGYEKDDLRISVEERVLTISSERKPEENEETETYIRREFRNRPFSRSFNLPEEVNTDKISAKHKNGVLSVYLPKAEVKVNPSKEIKIG